VCLRVFVTVIEMNKSIFFAVVLGVIAAIVMADSESTIKNLKPNGVVVNDCPSFSWSKRQGRLKYTIEVKKGTKTVLTVPDLPNNKYTIDPYDFEKFMPQTGTYKWTVTASNGETSDVATFDVNTLSCIPPKSENKINNDLLGFNQRTVRKDGNTVTRWRVQSNQTLTVDGVTVDFRPYTGGGLDFFYAQEHFKNVPDTEIVESDLSVKVTPGKNDRILAFRYIHFTSGNSTISIFIDDGSGGNRHDLGCIGGGVGCEHEAVDSKGQHFTPSLNDNHKWGLFKRVLTTEVEEGKDFYLHLKYERVERQKDMGDDGAVNYLFFFSAVTFGECGSIPNEFYDTRDTSDANVKIAEDCPPCKDAGMRIPKKYEDRCTLCSSHKNDPDDCASIDYCVTCLSTNDVCIPSYTPASSCKEDAACSSRKDQRDCDEASEGDCAWCTIDGKCVAYDDQYSDSDGCSYCGLFTSKSQCDEKNSDCQWCGTIQTCVEKGESCPQCSVLKKEECTLEETYGACAYCNSKNKCLEATQTCNESCVKATSKDTCGGVDCNWCESSQKCTEYRVECKNCNIFVSSECQTAEHPGCTLCESGYCVSDKSTCPICSERDKDSCTQEQNITLNCKYCHSARKCMAKDASCVSCDALNGTEECGSYDGCVYCQSDQVCKNSDDSLNECECTGLSNLVCAHHSGCCYTDAGCFNAGDSKCDGGLDTTTIIAIAVVGGVVVISALVLIPVLIICCKPKGATDIEMVDGQGTIVVLPEGQPSMVVAQESLQSVNVDPATAVSIDESNAAAPQASAQDMANMQNMIAQQQMLNTMMAQQQMSMMMNPMMMNSMGMMNMSGMAGVSGMNSMGMDMNSMNMTGGMNSMNMNSMNMNSMNSAQPGGNAATPTEGTV